MARTNIKRLVNMSDPTSKRSAMLAIPPLDGLYMMSLTAVNPSRSDPQNRYWHGVVLAAFVEAMRGDGVGDGRQYTDEQLKDILVAAAMGTIPVINPRTGEVIDEVRPSTSQMDKPTFATLIERSVEWLQDKLGVVVPPPEMFYDEPTNGAKHGLHGKAHGRDQVLARNNRG